MTSQASNEQRRHGPASQATRLPELSKTDSESAGPLSSDIIVKEDNNETTASDDETATPDTIDGRIKRLEQNQDILAANVLSLQHQKSASAAHSGPAQESVSTLEAEDARVERINADLELKIKIARGKKRQEALKAELLALEGGIVSATDVL